MIHQSHCRFSFILSGKGGSAIQKLRADFPRTIIQVPDCASPERILVINGDPDQCYEALYQIIPVLTDSVRLSSFNRRRNQTMQTDGNSNEKSNSNESPVEIRLLVHQMYCGAIIGKGGQQVKELRQTHNVDIKVFSVCCPMSHERVIALRGQITDVIECIKVQKNESDRSFVLSFFLSSHSTSILW